MTQKILDRLKEELPGSVTMIKTYKLSYGKCKTEEKREKAMNFLKGLEDAEYITEKERRALFCYITV